MIDAEKSNTQTRENLLLKLMEKQIEMKKEPFLQNENRKRVKNQEKLTMKVLEHLTTNQVYHLWTYEELVKASEEQQKWVELRKIMRTLICGLKPLDESEIVRAMSEDRQPRFYTPRRGYNE